MNRLLGQVLSCFVLMDEDNVAGLMVALKPSK
jgi:hypothetical protein